MLGDVTYEKLSVATGGHIEGHFRYKTAGTLKKEEPQAGRRDAKPEASKPLPKHEPEAAKKEGDQAAIL